MAPERRLFAVSSPRGENADRECGKYFGRDLVPDEQLEDPGLSDVHMASRRAEEAAMRRYQASKWLQEMVGSLGLSNEPSEEELRLTLRNGIVLCNLLNKIHPGIIPKIIESPIPTSPSSDKALSAYQYFENVRNFLVAIEDMKLPSFEVPVLAEGSLPAGSLTKVVDSILALKAYYEWKEGKSFSPYKYGSHKLGITGNRSPSRMLDDAYRIEEPVVITPRSSHARKRWAIPSAEMPEVNEFPVSFEAGTPNAQQEKHPNGLNKGAFDDSENLNMSSPAARIHQIGQKFRDVLQVKRLQDIQASDLDSTSTLKPSQSLPNLVKSIISDKQPEEIPGLIEFMMKKVVEEFEKRQRVQTEQVKKLKSSLRELMARESKLSSRAKVLEALAAGSGEEIKLVTHQLQQTKIEKERLEEEMLRHEKDISELLLEKEEKEKKIETLQTEVDVLKEHHQEQLETEARQAKTIADYQVKVSGMETELAGSLIRIESFEAEMARERSEAREREEKYKHIISVQSQAFEYLKNTSECIRADALDMQHCWQEQLTALEIELQSLTEAAQAYYDVLAENRRLYNEVQDLKGNIRVYCRVRPFLAGQPDQTCIDFVGDNGEIMISNTSKQGKDISRTFNFNKVYGPVASQEEVFLDAQPLIRSVLDGYNVCIFAYGQTGSGKTYTMTGPSAEAQQAWGVNYRALHDLFQLCQKRRDAFSYEVGVQMIEIYNEQVRDLLAADGVSKRLGIRTSSSLNGVHVPEAIMVPVTTSGDVLEIMFAGQRNRAVGATALNERSSRSHSVLTVHVQSTDLVKGGIFRGCLHLVDLAGSERVEKSEATGDRLKEAQHINKSLSALGDVIAALAQKSAHIPYRNSKLTQLLKHSLGGQAKALMFVHVNPDTDSYNETISTLKFAERVSGVELGAARTNREAAEVREYKEQISHLKEILARKEAEIERFQVSKLIRSSTDLDKQRLHKNRLSFDSSRGVRKSLNGRAAEAALLSSSHSRPSSRDSEPEARKSQQVEGCDVNLNSGDESFVVHQCSFGEKDEVDFSEGDGSQESGSDTSSQQQQQQVKKMRGAQLQRSMIPRLPPRSERKAAGGVGESLGSVSGLRRLSDVGGVGGEELMKRGSRDFQNGLLGVASKSGKRWV